MEDFILKILSQFKGVRNNQEQHVYVITIGLVIAVFLAITLIGRENMSIFFQQFSTNITASNPLAIALLTFTCILSVLYIVAGLLELNESNEKFKSYIPAPPQGAWILNIIVCVLVTLLMYTSITNILQYCIIYSVLIFADLYFRYAIANSANVSIQAALKDISLKRATSNNINVEYEIKYKMLTELFIYYKKYPFLSIVSVRMLLTISSIILIVIGKYTNNSSFINFAYISMIYCLVINEIFSWGYRLKLLISLRDND